MIDIHVVLSVGGVLSDTQTKDLTSESRSGHQRQFQAENIFCRVGGKSLQIGNNEHHFIG